jgi:O-antigen polysaccharide polymerase Wzy
MIKGSRIIDPLFVFIIGVMAFWVLPEAIRIGYFNTYQEDEVYRYLAISAGGVALSYVVACVWIGRMAGNTRPQSERDEALRLSARLIGYLAPVCAVLAAAFVGMRWGTEYGEGDSMPYAFQIFLYAHLYTFFFYLRFVDEDEVKSRRFVLVSLAVLLPRLLIATHWGRFFVGQAMLPFVFALLVGGNVMIRMRHLLMIVAGAGCIYFVLPLLRGDDVGSEGTESVLKFIAAGGPVSLVGQVEEVEQTFPNVNFLMTGLIGPFAPNLLSAEERIDIWGQEGAPLTLDRAFAALEGIGFYSLTGPGSVYVADLLVLGGMGALLAGSVVIGIFLALTRSLYRLPALFSLALFDIVSKIVFLPRTSFTYLIDRIAILTLICAVMLYGVRRASAAK